ncbi:MAG TPA: T9SS type A sorting domain-containing protein, partial [Prolixibacteraceae bacterium]|nr:T9SS type A sorting domain-containing protein [Prolixibacteraceae bacterium]
FETGVGYIVRRQTSNGVVSFNGTPISGEVTVPVTNNTYGWNSVGNPYTSAIGVTSDAASTQNFLTENAAILDDNYEALYIWNESAGVENADYEIISNANFTFNTGKIPWDTDYLQVGQGFIVKANASGNVTFTPEMQTHIPSQPFKSAETGWPGIIVSATSNGSTASTGITFYEGMTEGLDAGYDAGVLSGNANISVFTRLVENNGVDFGLQCLPVSSMSGATIPVGIEAAAGEVTFNFEPIEMPSDISLLFEDRFNNIEKEISKGENTYTTTLTGQEESTGRFFFSVKRGTGSQNTKTQQLKAWHNNGIITIEGINNSNAQAVLYNLQGRKIMDEKLENIHHNHINVSGMPSGIYMLYIQNGQQQKTLKMPVVNSDH